MPTPEAETPGLRERKNRRTRLAIVRATSELTIEGGYAAATIAKIAERADVAPRTVSTWFPSKDDILFEGSDETVERGLSHLRAGDGDVVDRLLAWFADEAARGQPDPEIVQLRSAAIQHDPELRARYHEFFGKMQAAFAEAAVVTTGAGSGNLGPQLFAGAVLAFLEQLAARAGFEGGEPSKGIDDPDDVELVTGIAYLRAALAAITP